MKAPQNWRSQLQQGKKLGYGNSVGGKSTQKGVVGARNQPDNFIEENDQKNDASESRQSKGGREAGSITKMIRE